MGPLGWVIIIFVVIPAIVYFVCHVCEDKDDDVRVATMPEIERENELCGIPKYRDMHNMYGEVRPEYTARKMYEEIKRLEEEDTK